MKIEKETITFTVSDTRDKDGFINLFDEHGDGFYNLDFDSIEELNELVAWIFKQMRAEMYAASGPKLKNYKPPRDDE